MAARRATAGERPGRATREERRAPCDGWRAVARALLLLLLVLPALAVAQARVVAPGAPPALREGEGLLLVAADSDVAISLLQLAERDQRSHSMVALRDAAAGVSTRLLALPAGRYVWRALGVRDGEHYRFGNGGDTAFEVVAGRITYPGDVVVRLRRARGPAFAIANRGLRALDRLEAMHPGVSAQHRFAFSGHYPDPFPAFYARERAAWTGGARGAARTPVPVSAGTLPLSPMDLWHPRRLVSVSLAPAGDLLAEAVRENDALWAVDLIDFASGARTRIASGEAPVASLHWAGDGLLLAGTGTDDARAAVTLYDIRDAGGSAPVVLAQRLPQTGRVLAAGYGDGTEVLLERRGDDGRREVVAVDIGLQEGARRFAASARGRLDGDADPGVAWFADAGGRVLAATLKRDDGTLALMYGEGSGLREVLPLRDEAGFRPLGLSADGALVYGLSDEDRAQRELVAFDPRAGEVVRTLYREPGADLVDVALDARGEPVAASWMRGGQVVTRLLGDAVASDAIARAFPEASVELAGRSRDGNVLALWVEASDRPPALYRFDVGRGEARLLDVASPWLHGRAYVRATALHAEGRDGTPLEAFLALPAGQGPRPVVVLAHGGPVGVGDNLRFNPEVQFLAALGYAVLQVNYRGSDGYGTAFREAGYHAAGTAIEDDIAAALDAALARFPLDASRMCIMGSSYGGYSALQSSIRWPERFRCAVSIAGISDRPLFFTASDSGNLPATRAELERVVGDPRQALAAMVETSPLYRYRELTTPVLLVHGREDSRVDFEHARRLVRMLELAGRDPLLLAFADEGHAWDQLADVDRAYRAIAGFLRAHLGEVAGGTGANASVADPAVR